MSSGLLKNALNKLRPRETTLANFYRNAWKCSRTLEEAYEMGLKDFATSPHTLLGHLGLTIILRDEPGSAG